MEFERVRLQSVVRSLRTTDGKRTPSTSVMCAFAPPEKTLRRGLVLSQDSKEEEEEEKKKKKIIVTPLPIHQILIRCT